MAEDEDVTSRGYPVGQLVRRKRDVPDGLRWRHFHYARLIMINCWWWCVPKTLSELMSDGIA